jgi:AcrR family transcriptional regulator
MRQEERRARTIERLLDAAAEVFTEVGFHAATVDDVATAAGYTKGAVYGNFASKDSLFLALIDRHLADQLAQTDELVAPASAELRARIREASEKQQGADGSFGLLMLEFWQYAARDAGARAALAARYAQIRERLAGVIAQRDAATEVTAPRRPEDVATLVLALDAGLFLQKMLDPEVVTPELRADAISAVIDRHGL